MQRGIHLILIAATTLAFASCGSTSDKKDDLSKKKAQLEELKTQQTKVGEEITKLEDEIFKLDPSSRPEKAKLVGLTAIAPSTFTHYIDLQGKIESDNIAYVTPRGSGGQVKAVYVKKGDAVKKGQLLLKLDAALAQKQLEQAETQLTYAKDLYQRRDNLWKQNIGTEVELIGAKNNVDLAEKQIALIKEQMSFSNVYAEMDGVADDVTIRVGEFFTGNPQSGYIRLVNTSNLKVTAQVPENYLGKVKEGDNLLINLPDINKNVNARITNAGKMIDPNSRSFYVEAKLPTDNVFRPNQIALVKIQDYTAANAITVPVNTLQTDDKGKFVLVAVKENGKLIARKRAVTEGQMYSDKIEVKNGLQQGDSVITEGFQGLYDGQLITTS